MAIPLPLSLDGAPDWPRLALALKRADSELAVSGLELCTPHERRKAAVLADRLGVRLGAAPPEPRSNSFVYLPERSLGFFDASSCPFREGAPLGWDGVLLAADEVTRYRCPSRDFSAEDIRQVVRGLGQVYLERGCTPWHTDFQRELALLAPDEGCCACPRYAACPGLWRADSRDVFAEAEAALFAELETCHGRVLDVGGGSLRDPAQFGAWIREGHWRYEVVEPAPPESLRAFAAEHGARLEARPIEACALEDAAYDAILVLRSHNHFADPRAVYAQLTAALKPGGTLLVADNAAFGVLRCAESFAATEREGGAARFEHYRNDTLAWARRAFAGLPLEERVTREVAPGRANQWFVRLTRVVSAA